MTKTSFCFQWANAHQTVASKPGRFALPPSAWVAASSITRSAGLAAASTIVSLKLPAAKSTLATTASTCQCSKGKLEHAPSKSTATAARRTWTFANSLSDRLAEPSVKNRPSSARTSAHQTFVAKRYQLNRAIGWPRKKFVTSKTCTLKNITFCVVYH